MESPALFVLDRGRYVATALARGPWNPAHTNGSAALALLAHCLDDVPTLVPMSLARFTVDLQRAVPVGKPLTVHARVTREGKKLQVSELSLCDGDTECVRATALRLRDADHSGDATIPGSTTDDHPALRITPREKSYNFLGVREEPSGALLASDILLAERTDSSASATWIRLHTPVVAGEPIRTTSRMAYAFDFASLVGMTVDISSVLMINPDVTAHVLRPMVGEWIALTGATRIHPALGRGISYAEASDDLGVFAVVSTSQIVEPRS